MRLLGLDVGDKRIGVAVSDPDLWLAQSLTVIQRVSSKRDFQAIADLVREYEVEKVIIGLPRTMAGEIGEQARKVQEFGRELEERSGMPVEFWDERLTTTGAQKLMIAAGVKRARRKQIIDAVAAALILQGYLDFLKTQARQKSQTPIYED
ncbi:MAG: Holliday junction resolvase RuvX [Chloroflexi bacterium]|nr:Holliday junction resolvase RuvX [Chloroflexota bacterium]